MAYFYSGSFGTDGKTFILPLADCPAAGCTGVGAIAWASTNPADQKVLADYAAALDQEKLEGVAKIAVVGTAASPIGLTKLAASGLGTWQAAVTAFSVGAGFQTAGDYFKTGEVAPLASLIAGGTALVYTPLLAGSIWSNALIGGAALGTNAMVQNGVLGNNESVALNYGVGIVFSGVGFVAGKATGSLAGSFAAPWVFKTPFNPNVPALLQMQPNPLPGQIGNAINSIVNNLSPFVDTSKTQQGK